MQIDNSAEAVHLTLAWWFIALLTGNSTASCAEFSPRSVTGSCRKLRALFRGAARETWPWSPEVGHDGGKPQPERNDHAADLRPPLLDGQARRGLHLRLRCPVRGQGLPAG